MDIPPEIQSIVERFETSGFYDKIILTMDDNIITQIHCQLALVTCLQVGGALWEFLLWYTLNRVQS